jgi:hypothetical protein
LPVGWTQNLENLIREVKINQEETKVKTDSKIEPKEIEEELAGFA